MMRVIRHGSGLDEWTCWCDIGNHKAAATVEKDGPGEIFIRSVSIKDADDMLPLVDQIKSHFGALGYTRVSYVCGERITETF